MHPIPTTRVTLGASSLGTRSDPDRLADELLGSPFAVDTSNNYAEGRSEHFLGRAIDRAGGGAAASPLVYTKADADSTGRFDGDRVRASLEESLTRLRLDRLPLYHLHDPYTISFAEAMTPGGAVDTLIALRDEGVVGAIGIASGTARQVHQYVATGAFDAVISHNRYTLVDRTAEPIFQLARQLGMTVFNAAPFGGGTLANNDTSYSYRPMSAEFSHHIGRVRGVAADFGIDLAAAALQFSRRSSLVDSTIVGISSVERLRDLGELMSTAVPDELFDAVDALGPPPPSGTD